MIRHAYSKGLSVPISGVPRQEVEVAEVPRSVAVLAADYIGMRPRMLVQVGDPVKRGQRLFEDRKTPGVFFTAPGTGTVVAINRGERRAFQSIVIELDAAEHDGAVGEAERVSFSSWKGDVDADGAAVRELLLESGLWTAFRTRPFSKVPAPDAVPAGIFVTAMDTQPHAPSVDVVLDALTDGRVDFARGLGLIGKLTPGKTWLCKAPGSSVKAGSSGAEEAEFQGPHPVGCPGVHIHALSPVSRKRTVWHIGYQDVVAVGRLFRTGVAGVERIVALAGPAVKNPRLLRTRLGADLATLTRGELEDGQQRLVSGSVLHGRAAMGPVHGFLGRYTNQISALTEGTERHFLGWAGPGLNRFSTIPAFLAKFLGRKSFPLTTDTNGGKRAMVPIGMYERVMPMDIMPTFLLRALAAGDLERAEALGFLELDEEDLACCTFVCPSKIDYGPLLRDALTQIEKEG